MLLYCQQTQLQPSGQKESQTDGQKLPLLLLLHMLAASLASFYYGQLPQVRSGLPFLQLTISLSLPLPRARNALHLRCTKCELCPLGRPTIYAVAGILQKQKQTQTVPGRQAGIRTRGQTYRQSVEAKPWPSSSSNSQSSHSRLSLYHVSNAFVRICLGKWLATLASPLLATWGQSSRCCCGCLLSCCCCWRLG